MRMVDDDLISCGKKNKIIYRMGQIDRLILGDFYLYFFV